MMSTSENGDLKELKILICDWDIGFTDYLQTTIIRETSHEPIILSQNYSDDVLKYFLKFQIPVTIIEIEGQDGTLKMGINLFYSIKGKSNDTIIIIYSKLDKNKICEKIPELCENSGKTYYFSKGEIQKNCWEFIEIIKSTLESFTHNTLVVHDRRILEMLDKCNSFDLFGIQFKPFYYEVEEEIKLFENDDHTLWFGKLYDVIFKNRIQPVLINSELDFIDKALKKFIEIEPILYITPFYSLQKRYRDHFLHQVRIAVLGDFLLDTYINEKLRLIDYISGILKARPDDMRFSVFNEDRRPKALKKIIRITWWVSALMHDCTYPLFSIFSPLLYDELSSKDDKDEKEEVYPSDFLSPFIQNHNIAKREFTEYLEAILPDFLPDIKIDARMEREIKTKDLSGFDHNLIGALNLWNLSKKPENTNQHLCVELACQTILLHHPLTELESGKITFREYPLAFLLILLDEIQEWNRPVVVPAKGVDPTKMKKYIELKEIKINGLSKKNSDSEKWSFDRDGIIFTLDYSNNDYITKSDILEIKNSKLENLNRLNIEDAHLPDITIEFKSEDRILFINIKKTKYE